MKHLLTKSRIAAYTLLVLSAGVYFLLAYKTPRTDFTQLLLLYTFAFAAYLYVANYKLNIWHSIAAAMVFRLIFIVAEPALSDDYFRFIWDGRLLAAGINPYAHIPTYFIQPGALQVAGITTEVYKQLNSQQYFSVYPPVSQGVFWLAAKLSPESIMGSVVVIRFVLILAELGSILLLLRLLRKMGLPEKHLLLYALNPLVIIELTGNLHFEALMIFFVLLALHQLFYQRILVSGVAIGMAVGTKLLPLMFLPFLLRKLGSLRFIVFTAAMGVTLFFLFYPLVTYEQLINMWQSVDLYFHRFEFNASIYYLLRWIGFKLTGYNQIAVLGPVLSMITMIAIFSLASVKRLGSVRRLAGYMAVALTLYFFLATTVHPWYICTILALTVVSRFRYAVVWSGLAILTYAAYRHTPYREDLSLVSLEYALVFLWLAVELYLYRQRRKHANLKE
ncbi:glycosyltransferase 87 family protein [Pontibacter sp. H249]|uniref:glycosyltransferase 87 family protein n=1 Tax=Pontibacter sp. H249 TaxID=3133420 RepID=UPI0030BC2F04